MTRRVPALFAHEQDPLGMNMGSVPDMEAMWSFITRLGEAQIVLPLALAPMLAAARSPHARALAFRWLAGLSLAILMTTATKLAFIGWGVGSASLDFTGISGHTMLAMAVYPVLLSALTGTQRTLLHGFAVAAGCAIAVLIGVSRVVLGAHSVSEVLAGWLVGGAVSAAVLIQGAPLAARIGATLPAVVATWLLLMPTAAPASNTHSLVTRLALSLSGHDRPYTRSAMRSEVRR